MVPFHVAAGAIDTRPTNIVLNWVIPIGLVVWGVKQTSVITESEEAWPCGCSPTTTSSSASRPSSAAAIGSTDVGEALATAERIADGDADSWIREWTATAERARGAGETARHAGRRVTALSFYRRAADLLRHRALLRGQGLAFWSPTRASTWRSHRDCWEHVVDLSPVPGERISIPYEGTDLRGYFFRAPDAAPGERRPLVIMNNGSDGTTSAMWGHGGAAAGERGYHWMTFDGPGQQYALYEQSIPFRHDWEAVLTPVLDALLERGTSIASAWP